MQNVQPLFNRADTLLGVCEGLGEDFGFNPIYLRVTLPVLLFFYPVATIAGYAAAGAIVLLSRLLVPNPRPSIHVQREDCAATIDQREESVIERNKADQPLALAA